MSKRILIISSFYEGNVGYQEVQFAETLYSMGYTVKVAATDRSNLDEKKRFNDSTEKFEVKRIKKLIRIKNTFYPKENLENFFSKYNPHVIFLILPGSGTPYFLLKQLNSKTKIISVYSDTTIENKTHKAKGTKGNKFVFNLLKKKWYNEVFERSDLIMANTNETAAILKSVSKKNIDDKVRVYGLGFDSNKYFYSEKIRNDFRKELGLNENQKLIATISRIYPGKPFEYWVEQVKDFLKENSDFVYLLGGFSNTEYSNKIKTIISEFNLGKHILFYDFTTPEENNKIFNAADYSLWFAPTISIQQSMATGLFAILPYDSTLDHLIENEVTGIYYNNFDELKNLLPELRNYSYDRKENSQLNQKFSYQNILQKVITEVN